VHDRDPDGNGTFDEGNGVTTLVSVNTNGTQGKKDSDSPAISADGNLIAFESLSANLVADFNRSADIFVHDRAAATTICVSVDPSGNTGDNWSALPSISADGRCVSFMSSASNLVPGDTNNSYDIFVRELANGTTTRVSVDSSGIQGDANCESSALSSDGSIVAFDSWADNLDSGDTNHGTDIFIHDRGTGSTERVSRDSTGVQGNGWSYSPSISADGQVVAFYSEANNLVANDTNALWDIFVHDRATGTTTAASFNCGGVPGDGASILPSISSDGSIVVFSSLADNFDSGDTNGFGDIFAHDLTISDPNASWNNYGAGFPGTHGIPGLSSSANPVLGTTISIDIGNSLGLSTTGFLLLGTS
jgi:Tol biopolymer transport system component